MKKKKKNYTFVILLLKEVANHAKRIHILAAGFVSGNMHIQDGFESTNSTNSDQSRICWDSFVFMKLNYYEFMVKWVLGFDLLGSNGRVFILRLSLFIFHYNGRLLDGYL